MQNGFSVIFILRVSGDDKTHKNKIQVAGTSRSESEKNRGIQFRQTCPFISLGTDKIVVHHYLLPSQEPF